MLGILTLDTGFPRIRGDVGCPETFPFPVRFATPKGAAVDLVVHRRDDSMLPAFIEAGRGLVDAGAVGIATTCGFLARWQDELTAALTVPVLSSALLQAPLVARTLPKGRRVGIVTYSAVDVTPELLAAVGLPAWTPVEGVDPVGTFGRTIRHGTAKLDVEAMAADVAGAIEDHGGHVPAGQLPRAGEAGHTGAHHHHPRLVHGTTISPGARRPTAFPARAPRTTPPRR